MCSPDNGNNTPEDAEREARVLEEREGMEERRKPTFAGFNGGAKFVITVLISVTFGFMLPKLFDEGERSGGVSEYIEADRQTMEEYEERIRDLELEASQGGRWSLENQMDYASVQQQEFAKIKIQQTEHISNVMSELERLNEILLRLDKRMERMEKKLP